MVINDDDSQEPLISFKASVASTASTVISVSTTSSTSAPKDTKTITIPNKNLSIDQTKKTELTIKLANVLAEKGHSDKKPNDISKSLNITNSASLLQNSKSIPGEIFNGSTVGDASNLSKMTDVSDSNQDKNETPTGGAPKLPENLPKDLVDDIQSLKDAAMTCINGKSRFFTTNVNSMLLGYAFFTHLKT